MTAQNIEELRQLAQAATPGIWCHIQRGISRWHGERIEVDLNPICDFAMIQDCCVHEYDRACENAAYIQAANPAAIIGLIDTIQVQAERIKVLERESEMRRIALHEAMLEANTLRAAPVAIVDTRDALGLCAPAEEDFTALYALQGRRVALVDLVPNAVVSGG